MRACSCTHGAMEVFHAWNRMAGLLYLLRRLLTGIRLLIHAATRDASCTGTCLVCKAPANVWGNRCQNHAKTAFLSWDLVMQINKRASQRTDATMIQSKCLISDPRVSYAYYLIQGRILYRQALCHLRINVCVINMLRLHDLIICDSMHVCVFLCVLR